MITYRLLDTQDAYVSALVDFVSSLEGPGPEVYPDNDGKATIGYGYTFNRPNNLALWTAAGITLTDAERALLQTIDNAPDNQKTNIALTQFTRRINTQEAKQLLRQTYPEYEGP